MNKLIHSKDGFLSFRTILMLVFSTLSIFVCHAQTNVVGSMGGEVTVSPFGTASYSIPIEVVPGTQGIQPNLSITYNSAAGRGLLGMGWNLTGLSSIARTQRNQYFDNAIGAINFDGNDRYTLDGSRLIKLSGGSYAATNAEYGTEIEDFTRVTLKGTPDGNTQYFLAVTPEGSVVEYGHTANSKQQLDGGILSWWINKMTDPDGNYMDFEYTCDDGEMLPSRILYTGNTTAGLNTYAKVVFEYEDSQNANQLWVGGTAMVVSNLLSSIGIYYDNNLVRSYRFLYDHDRSDRLTAVILKDENGREVTRTTIDWGEDASTASFQSINDLSDYYHILPGDFNGDNIEDLFLYRVNYNRNNPYTSWLVRTGKKEGGFTSTPFSAGTINGSLSQTRTMVVDFNGDGNDEIGYIPLYSSNSRYYFKMLQFTGTVAEETTLASNETAEYYIGDFTGEGGAQLLKAGQANGNYKTIVLDGSNAYVVVPANAIIAVTDNNGNGKAELFVSANNSIDVYELNGANSVFVKTVNSIWTSYFPTEYSFGDFNGDGMQDYVFLSGTATYMKISKGNDYTPAYHMSAYDNIPINSPILVGDINGDGKDDIVRPVFDVINLKIIFNVFYTRSYSDNNVYCDTIQIRMDSQQSHVLYNFCFSDFIGDSKQELLCTNQLNSIPKIINFPERRDHDFVLSVTNGLGLTTSMDYRYYNSPSLGNLGPNAKRIHYPLVSKLRQPDGIGGYNVTTFTYGNAEFDFDRRQLLGFGYNQSYCNGTNTYQQYIKNGTYHYLLLEQSLAYHLVRDDETGGYNPDPTYWGSRIVGTSPYQTYNTLGYKPVGYNRFIPYFPVSSIVNQLEDKKKTVLCELDADGRISQSITVYENAETAIGYHFWISRDSTVYTYTNVSLSNGKTAVKPSNIRTWNKRKDCAQTPFHNTAYTYNATGKVATNTVTDSDGAVGVASYIYNGFGLPTSETYTPAEMGSRTKSFAYDAKGRFLTQETNALGHVSSTAYDNPTGRVISKTDVNNLTTHYQYDALGRLTQVTRPNRTVHHFYYLWYHDTDFPNAVYYVQETEVGTPNTRSYYDILGRVVHSYCEGQGYNDILYDSLGRVARQTSIPYRAQGNTKTWRTFTYDVYDRITEEDGPYTDLSYSYYDYTDPTQHAYFVSVFDNVRETRRIKTYDALGRLVSAVDHGGTIYYAYGYNTVSGVIRDSTSVTLGNAVTTMISDIRGNRITINDPDAGTVQCTYDAMNQLVRRVDANGVSANCDYDLLGRMTREAYEKNNVGEVVRYTYDNASGKGIGKLASVQHDGSTESVYYYDTLGRLSDRQVWDGNTVYDHLYEYDTLGRLQYLTYPYGYCIKHDYNDYGELTTIRNNDDNSVVYAIDERNKFRQPVRCRFGNNTGTQYSYNSYGMLTRIKNGILTLSDPTNNGGTVMGGPFLFYIVGSQYRDLTYSYNSRGFISTKAEANSNQTETYDYDELDRLTSYRVNGVTAASFEYGNSGNITSNTRVGEYNYNASRPHAVASIDGNSRPTIPPTICDVTYNLRNRPTLIDENGIAIAIDYDASGMRRHTTITNGHSLIKEKTRISELFEMDATPTTARRLDYVYAEGRVVAVHVDEGGSESVYNVLTDHLGSWEKVMDEDKNIVQQTHFDPWGNRMSYTAWNTPQTQTSFTFDRGFTGHEHYDILKIINANARLYDPVIGRFFSPDPFVQTPDFTQGFNRYSYCMNNPVMYSDPDGEFFIVDSWIGGFVSKFFQTGSLKQSWQEANKRAGNDVKLWGGLLVTDENKSFWGRTWEFFSRLTWQAPQTIVGWFVAESCNTLGFAGGVESVDYKYGATVTRTNNSGWGAVTLGSYITGSNSIRADENNSLFQHEYGHYLQSQEMGLAYLPRVGVPSILSSHDHDFHPVEQDANRRAFLYFNRYVDGFYKSKHEMGAYRGWDFYNNPLNIDHSNISMQYIDYHDEQSLQLLDKLAIHAKWYDYASWMIAPSGPIAVGLYNAMYYNAIY